MEKLIRIKDYLDKEAEYDIGHKNRYAEIVTFRTLYYKIATETTNQTLTVIGKIVNRDHASVIYARKNLFDELMTIDRFRDIYFEYRKNILGLQVTEEYKNETQYNELKEKYNMSLDIIQEFKRKEREADGLTQVERDYRKLEPTQQEIYNQRVKPILKSFAWKKHNSEYETINCSQ
jgi:hypothetical protein